MLLNHAQRTCQIRITYTPKQARKTTKSGSNYTPNQAQTTRQIRFKLHAKSGSKCTPDQAQTAHQIRLKLHTRSGSNCTPDQAQTAINLLRRSAFSLCDLGIHYASREVPFERQKSKNAHSNRLEADFGAPDRNYPRSSLIVRENLDSSPL